jgi:7-cyano-7-deazaguanine synthase in queuosine biosynthesis
MTEATVYKPCVNKCGTCRKCKDFAKVLQEIDIDRTSKYERQLRQLHESRKDHR